MRKLHAYRYCLFAACLFCNGLLQAQNTEEIKAKFPGEEAVVLNHSVAYQLKITNGEPTAESKELEQIMYLSPNAVVHMSRYNFYQSGFHELQNSRITAFMQ